MPAREEAVFEQRLELPAELLAPLEVEEAVQVVDTPAEQAAEVEAPTVDVTPRVDEKKPAAPKKTKHQRGNEPLHSEEEIEELLHRSGWEKHEGPFRGFGSPPGKF